MSLMMRNVTNIARVLLRGNSLAKNYVRQISNLRKHKPNACCSALVWVPARSMTDVTKPRPVELEELLSTAQKISGSAGEAVIIDVREPHEIQETGIIPGGINIPLGTVEAAMGMSEEEFSAKYGIMKPNLGSKIILSCRSGKRSADAYHRLEKLGFKNLYNYEGGWLGYESHLKSQS